MKRMRTISAWLCFLGATGYGAAGQSSVLSADELIAKNIEAKGGMAKIKAISSLRMAGSSKPKASILARRIRSRTS